MRFAAAGDARDVFDTTFSQPGRVSDSGIQCDSGCFTCQLSIPRLCELGKASGRIDQLKPLFGFSSLHSHSSPYLPLTLQHSRNRSLLRLGDPSVLLFHSQSAASAVEETPKPVIGALTGDLEPQPDVTLPPNPVDHEAEVFIDTAVH